MKKLNYTILLCFMPYLFSCRSQPSKKIVGTYVKENTWFTQDTNTGKILGTTSLRDTISITEQKECYQVSDVKWRKNDYDDKGWTNQAHSRNQPLHTYQASYDQLDQSLNPLNTTISSIIYMDFKNGLISLNKRMENPWKKIK